MSDDNMMQINHDFTSAADGDKYGAFSSRIKVIGVGGGGNNAINHMYKLGSRDVSFIIANTDSQALKNSPVPTQVLLGPKTLRGRGAGNDPERAKMAAEESALDIDRLFDDETDMVFITAGMGGGTGTGASPVIARIAKERGILTIGIVTIPFSFEGKKKILKALDGAKEMSKYVDALLIINNERLTEIYSDLDFINAFGRADDILSMAAMSISEIVTCDGYINLDFNDVDNTLRDGGTAIISTGYGEGENRVEKAIEDALHSPLLRHTDIFGSRKLLFNLYFSPTAEQPFRTEETNQITKFVSNIDPNVDVIWGLAFDESLGNKVKFTILAAGFDVTINEDGAGTTFSPGNAAPSAADADKDKQRLKDFYGNKFEEIERMKAEQQYYVLKPEELDNDACIQNLEQSPSYKRDKAATANASTSVPADTPSANSVDFSDL